MILNLVTAATKTAATAETKKRKQARTKQRRKKDQNIEVEKRGKLQVEVMLDKNELHGGQEQKIILKAVDFQTIRTYQKCKGQRKCDSVGS